jgi:high-affinity Fe2+/Pb2+ permease
MTSMLTIAFVALLLAFVVARVVQKSAGRRPWFWPATGACAVAPVVLIYVSMQFSSQMVAWALLLLTPAAVAWATGWFVGSVLRTRSSANGS